MVANHTFLLETGKGEREILIDPTYKQYLFRGKEIPEPDIFVGTRADLLALFTKYRARIQPKFLNADVAGAVDPKAFVEIHYGFGSGEGARVPLSPKDINDVSQ